MIRGITLAVALGGSACVFSGPGGSRDSAPELGEPDLDPMPADDGAPSPDAPDDDGEVPPGADDPGPTDDGGRPGDQPLPPPSDPPSDDDGAADTGEGDDGSVGDTVGGEVECDVGFVDLLWAEDAQLIEPMAFGEATEAAESPLVALSTVADSGKVTFALDLPCAGDYYAFGLVWDYMPGALQNPDADSFYVDVGGPEFVWRYGCQTSTVAGGLSWQPLERLDGQPCETTGLVLQAPEPGVYGLTLRNREAGSGSAVAGVAAIVITTDPAFDPYSVYSPY